jgi:uncharacterized membrane protein
MSSSRLAYIDWLRGLACLLMFQTHCYDAWLDDAARHSKLFLGSQLAGTFPAPLFLFLAGTSLAIAGDKFVRTDNAGAVATRTIRRGIEIWALGMLFRLQEFLIAYRWAPWSDLFRVDILNTIGVSIVLMGALLTAVAGGRRGEKSRRKLAASALAAAAVIAALTPLLWTSWRPRWLPWPLESYLDGVHNLGTPQSWLFPIFPWTGFAFVGLGFGLVLASDFWKKRTGKGFLVLAAAALVLIYVAKLLDASGARLYPVYDFWHTSPNFFLVRVGCLLLLAAFAYVWCSWGLGLRGFSPLIQLGNTSLLVYWIHIEFVYGRFSILPRRSQTILGASGGLLAITLAMLVVSWGRTTWKQRGKPADYEASFSRTA